MALVLVAAALVANAAAVAVPVAARGRGTKPYAPMLPLQASRINGFLHPASSLAGTTLSFLLFKDKNLSVILS